MQSFPSENNAGLHEFLIVLSHCGENLFVGEYARLRVLTSFDNNHKTHRSFSFHKLVVWQNSKSTATPTFLNRWAAAVVTVWKTDRLRRPMSFVLMFTLQCLFPIFDLDAEFTGVSIVNPDTQSQTFAVSVTSSDGSSAHGTLVSLRPGAQRVASVKEIVPV